MASSPTHQPPEAQQSTTARLVQGIERHSILISMDQVWWQLRNKMDQYVEAAEDELRTFQSAFADFENYQASGPLRRGLHALSVSPLTPF